MLFDLVIKTVRFLIFSTSCYVLDLPLLCCLCSLYLVDFLSGLHAATLLDLLYLLLSFLGFPKSCDAAYCALYHTVLFGPALTMLRCVIVYVKLHCLTFPN